MSCGAHAASAHARLKLDRITVGQWLAFVAPAGDQRSLLGSALRLGRPTAPLPPEEEAYGSCVRLSRGGRTRCILAAEGETLRGAVEALSLADTRRVIIVHPASRVVRGVVSLRAVAALLFS